MDMNNMLSSFKESLYDFPAPEFKFFTAPLEDPERRCLPLELRQKVLGYTLASTKRVDHGIISPKVIMLTTSGCNAFQKVPRPLNFKLHQLNILLVCKSLNAEAGETLFERLTIKFDKHRDFWTFMKQEDVKFNLPFPARFAYPASLIHNFEFAFVMSSCFLHTRSCAQALLYLVNLARARDITFTVSAGKGGWRTGIWRDSFHRLQKAKQDMEFYQEIFPTLNIINEFESRHFINCFSSEILTVPEFDLDSAFQAKLERDRKDKEKAWEEAYKATEEVERTYIWKLFGEYDPRDFFIKI